MRIRLKRVYEMPAAVDGYRVLVDRVWPRGVSKQAAAVDRWCQSLAPSTELRKWFAHDPARFDEFADRYFKELDGNVAAVEDLLAGVPGDQLTLVYSAKDVEHNQAVVLKRYLDERAAG